VPGRRPEPAAGRFVRDVRVEIIMSNFKQKLKAARLPEDSVPVCLRGDLAADFEATERELKRMQEQKSDSLEEGVGPIIDRLDAIRAEMLEHTEDFRIRALPKPAFRALVADHPPRRAAKDDGSEGELDALDVQFGLNRDTFFEALLRASVISPELDEDDWTALFAVLTDRQFGDLTDAAWFLNRGEIDVPFSRAASRAKRTSGAE
jgi:hypothetical protein